MKPEKHQILVINKPTEEFEASNRASAAKRRATINEQIDEFFKAGGTTKKLPSYDEIDYAASVTDQAIYGRKYSD